MSDRGTKVLGENLPQCCCPPKIHDLTRSVAGNLSCGVAASLIIIPCFLIKGVRSDKRFK
jgi:hypothetical protein